MNKRVEFKIIGRANLPVSCQVNGQVICTARGKKEIRN